jgi:hypothetical protein
MHNLNCEKSSPTMHKIFKKNCPEYNHHPLGEFLPIRPLFTVGSSWKNRELAQMFGLLFTTVRVVYQFWQRVGWATFWVVFLQTHLVTLSSVQIFVALCQLEFRFVDF